MIVVCSVTDEKLSYQYVVQRPERISTGEDEFYDKTSGEFKQKHLPFLLLMTNEIKRMKILCVMDS